MKLIIGLGNPGSKYKNTRHNLGFMVLDKLAKELLPLGKTKWKMNKKAKALVLKVNPQLVLVKPQTYMNASGFAVEKLVKEYLKDAGCLFIVHDDVDLPLGKMKIRFGGASAGHHGVESIIEKLGTDKFWRFRLGIGRPNKNEKLKIKNEKLIEDYVLSEFREGEGGELRKMLKKAAEAIKLALKDGPERAMNRFN